MDGYKSLAAWQSARDLCIQTLKATENLSQPKTWATVGQLRRAVVSTDINIVEGYALGTSALFRRHLRIALGSAAESERLLDIIRECGYLTPAVINPLKELVDLTIRRLYGLLTSPRLATRVDPPTRPRTAPRPPYRVPTRPTDSA